jgi:hypothetical protein
VWAVGRPSRCVLDLAGPSSAVTAVAMNMQEDALAAGCLGGQLKLWDLEYGAGRVLS